jgi:hypothetical protein
MPSFKGRSGFYGRDSFPVAASAVLSGDLSVHVGNIADTPANDFSSSATLIQAPTSASGGVGSTDVTFEG